jgi:outer membrane protein
MKQIKTLLIAALFTVGQVKLLMHKQDHFYVDVSEIMAKMPMLDAQKPIRNIKRNL